MGIFTVKLEELKNLIEIFVYDRIFIKKKESIAIVYESQIYNSLIHPLILAMNTPINLRLPISLKSPLLCDL